MQKIDGLLPPKGASITAKQWQWCLCEMRALGIKTFSALIRHMIEKEMQKDADSMTDWSS